MTRYVVAARRQWRSEADTAAEVLSTPGVSLIDRSGRGRLIIEADAQVARELQAKFDGRLIIEQEASYGTLDGSRGEEYRAAAR